MPLDDVIPDPDAGGADAREEQRTRTRVGHVQEDDVDLYIGRHGPDGERDLLTADSPGQPGWLGNPYPVDVFGREERISMFTDALLTKVEEEPAFRRQLVRRVRGRVLGCWCRSLDEEEPTCHGDVIARVVDDVLQGVEGSREDVDEGDEGSQPIAPDGGREEGGGR